MTGVCATSATGQGKPGFEAAQAVLQASHEAWLAAPDWPRRRVGVLSTSHPPCHGRAARRVRAAFPTRRPTGVERDREERVRHTFRTTLTLSISFGGIRTALCLRRIN